MTTKNFSLEETYISPMISPKGNKYYVNLAATFVGTVSV